MPSVINLIMYKVERAYPKTGIIELEKWWQPEG